MLVFDLEDMFAGFAFSKLEGMTVAGIIISVTTGMGRLGIQDGIGFAVRASYLALPKLIALAPVMIFYGQVRH